MLARGKRECDRGHALRGAALGVLAAILAAGSAGAVLPPPTGLDASVDSCWGVRLSWDDLPGADSFEVRRGETVFHTIDLFFRDTGAPEGFSDYWVAGIDSDGAGERASATGRRLAVPNTPASFLASDTSCTLVRLSWDAAADADSYRVSRGGLLLATLPSTILFYEDTAPPGRYGYALSAGNACGWSGAAVDSGTVLSPPAPPAGLSASDTICGLVRLSWTAAAHADSFDVYRNSARIASVAGTEFEDVPSPGTYAYEVAARNSCGESSRAADSGTRPPDAPLAPSNPAASDTSCHFILLTWEDVADEEGYRIRRDGAPIATLPPGTTFYQDAAVASGTAHAYRIEAFNGCGGSFSSEVIGERIFGYPDPPNDVQASDALCDSVFVSWTYPGAPGQLDSFQVLFRAPGGPGWTRAGAVLPNAGPHFGFGHAQSSGSWEYRVAAFNSCGSSPASEGSTDDAEALTSPSVPAFFAASDSLCSRVELEWSASADADTYVVFRDGALLARVLAPALSYVDEPITGTHAYALRAANRCGRSAERTDAAYARPRPSPPANVSASTDSCGLIRIEWQGAPSDTGYYLYRDGAFLAKTPAGVFFFRDTGAPPGPHAYRVGALDICGRSDSIAANGIRPPDAPAAPSAFSATDNVCGAVFLSWSAVLDADSFYVYRDSIRIAKTAGTAFQDIPPVGTYRYEVSARNRCGEGPRAADTGVRPPDAPAAPLNLAASDAVCGAIEITWSAAANAEGYRVLRDGIHLADAGATFYSDFSAAPGSSYVYTANAWNGCGESGESAPDIGRRPWDAPEAPGGVSASFGRCDGVEIDWLDVIGEDGFVVERNGTILDTLESGETSYLDAAAPGGISLSYRVGAFNACGPVPSFSAPASGFRLPPPAVPASLDADSICGGVRLRWTDVSWEDGYAIARDGAVIDTAEADASEYIDAGATPGTAHEYAVGSFNACLAAPSFTSPVVGVRPYDAPAAPLSVSATDDLCGEIRISWIVSAHADSHRVFRNGAWIATVKGNAIIDTQAPPGTYAYTVRAKNFCGESVSSAPEAGTRLPDAPAAPTNPAASDTSCHFVLVTWGDVANEQGYRVFRDGQPIADLAANTTLFRDAFVGSGSPHSYQVQSYNSCGSAFSVAVLGERILGYPDPPVQVTASDSYCDRVTVTWVFTGGAVDSFAVSYRDTAALGWTLAGSASSSARMFTHVPAAGTYEYLVQAHNSCGASPEAAWSKDVGTRKRAPSAPAFLASSDREVCGNREFRLRWNRVAGAARYVVLDGSVEHDVGTDTTYASTKTAAGSYSFRVRAENSCGQSPTSSPWTVEVQASASAPTGVVSSNNLCGAIRISWTPSSASNVWIEREGSRVYVSGTGSWTDSLPAGGSRTYAVGGWNSCDTLGASAQPAGFAYPLAIAAPVGVQATRGLCDSVRVVWSYFPEQTGVDSFRVLRMEGPITSTVAVVPAGAPREAADRNVSTGTIYVYKVRAENPCAQAISAADTGYAYARPGAATWSDPASSACVGAPFRIRWNASAGAERYEVRKNEAPIDTVTGRELVLVETATGSHRFRVAGMNQCGYGTASEAWTVTVSEAAAAPTGVRLDTSFCDSVIVRWNPQTDSIRVYRSDRAEAIWKGPGNGRAVDYPQRAATYRVHSFNGCGESPGVEAALARPRLRPAAPSNVNATDGYCDSVEVAWSIPNPPSIPVEWVEIVRSRNDTTIVVGSNLPPWPSRFVDRGGSGTYRYEVVARNVCGASQGGATSSDQGGFLPAAGAVVFASSTDTAACAGGRFVLRWEPVPAALYYRVLETIGGDERVLAIVEGQRDSVSLSADAAGLRLFRVQATGLCGPGPLGEQRTVAVYRPPEPPPNLAATLDLCGEVRLTWPASAGSAGRFRVLRDGIPIGTAASAESVFVDQAVTEGMVYTYTVLGENTCGVSETGAAALGSSRPGLAAPALRSPPDGAVGLPIPVLLAWEPVEGAEGYAVRIEEIASGALVVETLLPPTDTSFLASELGLGTRYRWRAATRSACGVGVPGAWRTFGTLAIAPSALASDPANGEDEVEVGVVIRVTFSVPIDPTTLSYVKLLAGSAEVAGTRSLESGGNRLVFAPDAPLAYGTHYALDFSGLYDVFGRSFAGLPPIAFRTKPAERPFGDMDGDYQRDLADVDLAVRLLLGLGDPADPPFSRIDLNGDGRFNVADLVLLARVLVEEGTIVLGGKRAEPIAIEARAMADGEPNRHRVVLSFPIPSGARAGLIEIALPRGPSALAGVAFEGIETGDLRRAVDHGILRVLVTPPLAGAPNPARASEAEGRLALLFAGESAPAGIEVRGISWSDGTGGVRFFRPAGGEVLAIRSAGSLELRPNRPNPFNPRTEIHYFLPSPSEVRLRVLDPGGRVLALLVDRVELAGWHTAVWEGRTDAGAEAVSGVYFACLETSAGTRTVRMTLLR